MSVTVLIAAYNAAPFLDRAVLSALDQTHPPTEVLIVDDASSDDTRSVAQEMSRREPRIRVVGLDHNGGPAKARNIGIDEARGDWIAILDADDAFLPERLERLTNAASLTGADVLLDNFAWYRPASLKG